MITGHLSGDGHLSRDERVDVDMLLICSTQPPVVEKGLAARKLIWGGDFSTE